MANDFFKLLKKDHEKVKEILERLNDSNENQVEERNRLFSQLKTELLPHMAAEEKEFYPNIEYNHDFKKDVLEAYEEHKSARNVLFELDSMRPDNVDWSAKIQVLKELIEHHIDEEEDKIFDDAEEVINDDDMNKVMERFQLVKKNVKEEIK